jgi:hypothetical protein
VKKMSDDRRPMSTWNYTNFNRTTKETMERGSDEMKKKKKELTEQFKNCTNLLFT